MPQKIKPQKNRERNLQLFVPHEKQHLGVEENMGKERKIVCGDCSVPIPSNEETSVPRSPPLIKMQSKTPTSHQLEKKHNKQDDSLTSILRVNNSLSYMRIHNHFH